MRQLIWIVVSVSLGWAVILAAFSLVTSSWFVEHPVVAGLLYATVVSVPTLGVFWMIYMSIRHEKHPVPYILLAFVPFTCFWYYFVRVKTRRLRG